VPLLLLGCVATHTLSLFSMGHILFIYIYIYIYIYFFFLKIMGWA
jgi:hypothetical protein